jgi:gliding motility-associated lipoprotein GldH
VATKEMTKLYQTVLLGIVMLLFSCGKDRVFEEYHSFEGTNWEESDSVKFDLSSLDSLKGKALLGVRYTENYPFSNCYIKVIYRDSNKMVLADSLWNVPIFDKQTGKPIGDGFGNTFTTYDTLSFPFPASTREVIFLQYMRQPQLEGIEAVGFKVVKP